MAGCLILRFWIQQSLKSVLIDSTATTADVYADSFCCRPVGQMTCPYAVYSGDQGFITDEQDVVVVLAFSEPITGLRAESLKIVGPSGANISGLKLIRGTNTFYHFVVNLPGIYYDTVTVNLEVNACCIASGHAGPDESSASCH